MTIETLYDKLCRIELKIEEQLLLRKEVLNLKEAARFLDLSESCVYKMTSSNTLPFSRPAGKRIYFNRSDLEKWLSKNKSLSIDEIDAKANNYLINQPHLTTKPKWKRS